jgi:hypothetical protein
MVRNSAPENLEIPGPVLSAKLIVNFALSTIPE